MTAALAMVIGVFAYCVALPATTRFQLGVTLLERFV
jgi:hypothetical protein